MKSGIVALLLSVCVFIVHIRNPRPSMIILFPIIAGSHRIFLNDFFSGSEILVNDSAPSIFV